MDILKRSGEISAEASMATIRRHLRRAGLSRAQMQRAWTTDDHKTPTFHTQLKSKFPNHLHLFDITPCVQYFFDDRGKGLKQRDKNLQLYGTKMKEYRKVKKHLLRYVLVDHFSGTIFVQYFHASGERAADVIRFLWEAWRGQEEQLEQYPFRGVPDLLYLDSGAANLAGYTRTLMSNLNVEMIAHKPGNPRAKGGVEGVMPFWEGQFESRLSLKSAPDLDTLNSWALDYCIYLNAAKPHRRHGHSRSALWAFMIRTEGLRIPPEWRVFQGLAHSRPVTRKIGRDKMVHFKGQAYLVLDPVNLGDVVEVSHDPYNYPDINCLLRCGDGETTPIRTQILHKDAAGFYADHGAVAGEEYHRLPDAPTHAKVRELAQEDYTAAAAAAFEGWAEGLGNVSFPVRPGAEIETEPADLEPVTMTRLEGLELIRRATGSDIPVLKAQLIEKQLGKPPWPKEEVEAYVRAMKAGAEPGEDQLKTGVAG